MKSEMQVFREQTLLKLIIAILAVMFFMSLTLNLIQFDQIQTLHVELHHCMKICDSNNEIHRLKRDVSKIQSSKEARNTMFLPLFVQITQKQINELCVNRYETVGIEKQNEPMDVVFLPVTDSKVSTRLSSMTSRSTKSKSRTKLRKRKENMTCSLISYLEAPRKYGERLYDLGSAVRSGELFYITEYSMGYMLFEYNVTNVDTMDLLRAPSNIYTLPMPFFGTDHTVDHNKNFYYHVPSTKLILRYDLTADKVVKYELPLLDAKPLYTHSASWVDLEFDQGYIYVIFKEVNNTVFTIHKLYCDTMKKVDSVQVVIHHPESLVNCFVSCGVLYAIRLDSIQNNLIQHAENNITMEAVFNIKTNTYLHSVSMKNGSWMPENVPSNIQFDQLSQTLTTFNKGKILSLPIVTRKSKSS